ncbi:MAG: ATP-binding cassette domain-containing protein [Lachnospiraceae bacterium]|nr:ATP-binding cassette domain-containing protein [Lachnospiraceae bacterium]
MKKNVLLLKKISKKYQQNQQLNQFFLDIQDAEIVNLIGLEGSGKEDIFSILFGEEKIDSGEVWFMNKKYGQNEKLPIEKTNGIFFIDNNELMIPELSVAENLYIVEKKNYFQMSVPKKKMEQQAKQLLAKFNLDISPVQKAKTLKVFDHGILRLIRAYAKRARLIVINDILDDASYDRTNQLIELLNQFKTEGISILWMNSYPDAITEIADRVVAIRQGKNISTFYHKDLDKARLMDCLIGKNKPPRNDWKSYREKGIAFAMHDISNGYFDKMSFKCHQGEILGIYDIENKFSRELRRLLLGRREYEGEMYVNGVLYKADADYKLAKNKIGVIDGTKYQKLMFNELSAVENIEMPAYRKVASWKFFINTRVGKYLSNMGLEFTSDEDIEEGMIHMNRKNTMQLIYNRWYLINPKVLFCFQPFLRLDVVSRQQQEKILEQFARRKTGLVLSSADVSTLLPVCDRILLIENHKIVEEVRREDYEYYF